MMAPEHEFVTELRELLGRGQVVAVVGSGVSLATTGRTPTWRGLIQSAVARCRAIGVPTDECTAIGSLLELKSGDMLLLAAEAVDQKLREKGELAPWLRAIFEKLKPDDPALIRQIAGLGTPLVTTNYDDLIEKVTGLKPVTWKDPRHVTRVVRGDDRRVLHLHGHWDEPESVVLGIRSYEAVKNSDHTQAVMRAFGMAKSLLFVGCGDDGLADPNFGNFLTWLEWIETQGGVEHRHYRLVREQERFAPRGRLFPLVYGRHFKDLVPFLARLGAKPKLPAGDVPGKTVVRVLTPVPASIEYYLTRLRTRRRA